MARPFPHGAWLALRLALFVLAVPAGAAAAEPVPVKLLTVGNSFAVNATTFLPELARSGGKSIEVLNAYKGGCSLQEHAAALAAAEIAPESPAARIYSSRRILEKASAPGAPFNLIEALGREKWDFVTVQQASVLSDKPASYEPYAGQVIAAIRRYAPQAEILVHETWAYREDEPRFAPGGDSPARMHQLLREAYARLAASYRLRVIPVGDAFQAARALPRWTFVPHTAFDFAHAAEGTLPQEKGGILMGWGWKKNAVTGVPALSLDAHHANKTGQYLAAAVFYEVLFGSDVREAAFCPPFLAPDEAADLRRVAHETVQAQKLAEASAATP